MSNDWNLADASRIEISPAASLLEAEFDGEIVGLSLEKDVTFGFNGTATRIWEKLRSPIRLDALVAQLTTRYAVDAYDCERQVRNFISKLVDEGLVSVRALPAT